MSAERRSGGRILLSSPATSECKVIHELGGGPNTRQQP